MDELYWIWDQPDAAPQTGADGASGDYQIPPTRATVVYRLQDTEYLWDGMLWRIEGVGLDERTRTVPCRVIVRSPRTVWVRDAKGRRRAGDGPPALVRGMYVAVKVHVKPKAQLLSVPESAVRPGNKIWLAEPIPTAERPAAEERTDGATHMLRIVDVKVVEVAERAVSRRSDPVRASQDEDRKLNQVGERYAVLKADPQQVAAGDEVIISPLAAPVAFTNAGKEDQEDFPVIVRNQAPDPENAGDEKLAPRETAPGSPRITEKVS
jgi:hypothetical protein